MNPFDNLKNEYAAWLKRNGLSFEGKPADHLDDARLTMRERHELQGFAIRWGMQASVYGERQ